MNPTIGVIGIKLGMSRVFREEGDSIPVTVIQAQSNRICQIKRQDTDGYTAVQLAAGEQKPQRLSKALRGHYAKARVTPGRSLREFRVGEEGFQGLSTGDQLTVAQFVEGQKVDIMGTTKGKGFAGAIKRWNFAMQDATHGNSISHRHLGSTGQCQFPGKVWKGKKMAGQHGNKRKTTMRLEVVAIDEERQLLLIKGAVPGAEGGKVFVRPSKKQTAAEAARIEEKFLARAEQKETTGQEKEETRTEQTPAAEEHQKQAKPTNMKSADDTAKAETLPGETLPGEGERPSPGGTRAEGAPPERHEQTERAPPTEERGTQAKATDMKSADDSTEKETSPKDGETKQ